MTNRSELIYHLEIKFGSLRKLHEKMQPDPFGTPGSPAAYQMYMGQMEELDSQIKADIYTIQQTPKSNTVDTEQYIRVLTTSIASNTHTLMNLNDQLADAQTDLEKDAIHNSITNMEEQISHEKILLSLLY